MTPSPILFPFKRVPDKVAKERAMMHTVTITSNCYNLFFLFSVNMAM